jgi:hypothetical protein
MAPARFGIRSREMDIDATHHADDAPGDDCIRPAQAGVLGQAGKRAYSASKCWTRTEDCWICDCKFSV